MQKAASRPGAGTGRTAGRVSRTGWISGRLVVLRVRKVISGVDDELVAVCWEHGDGKPHRALVLVERSAENHENGGVVSDAEKFLLILVWSMPTFRTGLEDNNVPPRWPRRRR
jgi:hypothetical protein